LPSSLRQEYAGIGMEQMLGFEYVSPMSFTM
jgi:hypothetical protein